MKKFKRKYNYAGIAFMEMIVSIFVLSLILLAAISVSAVYLKNRSKLKQRQQATEELSLIADSLAKELRMSSCAKDDSNIDVCDSSLNNVKIFNVPIGIDISPDTPNNTFGDLNSNSMITVRSNNKNERIGYFFNNQQDQKLYRFTFGDDEINISFSNLKEIASNVKGEFRVSLLAGNSINDFKQNKTIPLIIIRMKKLDKNNNEIPGAILQTSVSQRSGYFVE